MMKLETFREVYEEEIKSGVTFQELKNKRGGVNMEFENKEQLDEYLYRNDISHLSYLEGAGFLGLTNHGGITAKLNKDGTEVFYQEYDRMVKVAPVERIKNEGTGVMEDGFYTDEGFAYLLQEFITIKRR